MKTIKYIWFVLLLVLFCGIYQSHATNIPDLRRLLNLYNDNPHDLNVHFCEMLARSIPDHVMKPESRERFSKEFLRVWDLSNEMPKIDNYLGYIADDEFLYYFVTGNGGSDTIEVDILSSKVIGDSATIKLKYYIGYKTYNGTYNIHKNHNVTHTIQLCKKGNDWLIDDYDNMKKRMTLYVILQLYKYKYSTHWKKGLDKDILKAFELDMRRFMTAFSISDTIVQSPNAKVFHSDKFSFREFPSEWSEGTDWTEWTDRESLIVIGGKNGWIYVDSEGRLSLFEACNIDVPWPETENNVAQHIDVKFGGIYDCGNIGNVVIRTDELMTFYFLYPNHQCKYEINIDK